MASELDEEGLDSLHLGMKLKLAEANRGVNWSIGHSQCKRGYQRVMKRLRDEELGLAKIGKLFHANRKGVEDAEAQREESLEEEIDEALRESEAGVTVYRLRVYGVSH